MRIFLVSMLVACGGAQTPTVVVADLDAPEPVRARLTSYFGAEAAIALEAEEDDDGTTEYESRSMVPMEVELSPGGHLLKIEFTVPLGMAPAAVIAAAEARWSGAILRQAEVVVENGVLLWEIEATLGDQELEAYFYPDGRARDADAATPDTPPAPDTAPDADADADAEGGGEGEGEAAP